MSSRSSEDRQCRHIAVTYRRARGSSRAATRATSQGAYPTPYRLILSAPIAGLPIVAFDEAGNTEPNLRDAAQPVLVLAPVHMDAGRARALATSADPAGKQLTDTNRSLTRFGIF